MMLNCEPAYFNYEGPNGYKQPAAEIWFYHPRGLSSYPGYHRWHPIGTSTGGIAFGGHGVNCLHVPIKLLYHPVTLGEYKNTMNTYKRVPLPGGVISACYLETKPKFVIDSQQSLMVLLPSQPRKEDSPPSPSDVEQVLFIEVAQCILVESTQSVFNMATIRYEFAYDDKEDAFKLPLHPALEWMKYHGHKMDKALGVTVPDFDGTAAKANSRRFLFCSVKDKIREGSIK